MGEFEDARIVEVYRGDDGQWYWRRRVRRGDRIVADGAEGYAAKAGAWKAAARENPAIEVVLGEVGA